MEQQYVEFNNLGKAFPGVQALKDVSFRVEGGQVCALLGENGAGKSTLLKILSGDLQPDEGHVRHKRDTAEIFITISGDQGEHQRHISGAAAGSVHERHGEHISGGSSGEQAWGDQQSGAA